MKKLQPNLLDSKKKSKLKRLEVLREKLRRKASKSLFHFILYTKTDYRPNWHHRAIANELNDFLQDPNRKRLMLFVPPQHGKSEIASRNLPAFALGINPNLKIAGASYSSDLAKSFNRDIKRIIDSDYYRDIFPGTQLNGKNVVTDASQDYLRNTEEFEVVGHKGSYKSVGVMGGLSGRRVDLAIIDDPVKDSIEANSPTYRARVWEWYMNVLETRLHKNSKVILIMTRWHEDDLAGRLLMNEPDQWEVLRLQAIKEPEPAGSIAPIDVHDPRQPGEALWESQHPLAQLERRRKLNPTDFEALYQQNPSIPGGNKVKKEWFNYCDISEVPTGLVWNLWVDGAYTKSTENDPTGLMVAAYDEKNNRTFIRHAKSGFLEMPELLNLLEEYCAQHGIGPKSRVYIEPKASGHSLSQMVRSTVPDLSPVLIKGRLVGEGKEARISVASPKIESGSVWLVKGNWNLAFVHQLTTFPKAAHDEYVDTLGYCIYHHHHKTKKSGVRRRN